MIFVNRAFKFRISSNVFYLEISNNQDSHVTSVYKVISEYPWHPHPRSGVCNGPLVELFLEGSSDLDSSMMSLKYKVNGCFYEKTFDCTYITLIFCSFVKWLLSHWLQFSNIYCICCNLCVSFYKVEDFLSHQLRKKRIVLPCWIITTERVEFVFLFVISGKQMNFSVTRENTFPRFFYKLPGLVTITMTRHSNKKTPGNAI